MFPSSDTGDLIVKVVFDFSSSLCHLQFHCESREHLLPQLRVGFPEPSVDAGQGLPRNRNSERKARKIPLYTDETGEQSKHKRTGVTGVVQSRGSPRRVDGYKRRKYARCKHIRKYRSC